MNLIYFHLTVIIIGIVYLGTAHFRLMRNDGFKRFGATVADPIALETMLALLKGKLISRVITGIIAYVYVMFSLFRMLYFLNLWTLEVIIFFIMLCMYVAYSIIHVRAAQTLYESTL